MDPTTAAVMPIDLPIIHESDRYDFVRDIGSGNFGVARLMTDRVTKELVAVKYIERGDKVRSFSIPCTLLLLDWYIEGSSSSSSDDKFLDLVASLF